MNLIKGELTDSRTAKASLERLVESTSQAVLSGIDTDKVISACGVLAERLNEKEHLPLLATLGIPKEKAKSYIAQAKDMFCENALTERLCYELPPLSEPNQSYRPIGVVLHIASGNAHGLPAYSVIEGLLCGNVNILKTSSDDDGISALILKELTDIEPLLKEFIYVYDIPSSDEAVMQKLTDASDAIVIWGGEDTVKSIRARTPADVKIIEWGHKIGFAYVSGDISDEQLRGIAYNIFETDQLLCTSCQTVYYDTEDYRELNKFAARFLEIMKREAASRPERGIYVAARKTVEFLTFELEGQNVLYGGGCGVIIEENAELKTSPMFGSVYIKPLESGKIFNQLKKYKSILQTAALICPVTEYTYLSELLIKSGVNRITDGYGMSELKNKTPHDGELPLRRLTKIVES